MSSLVVSNNVTYGGRIKPKRQFVKLSGTSILSAVIAVPTDLKGRSFTRVSAWEPDELLQVLDLADRLKQLQSAREEHRLLPGRTLGMIFQKPSTRTRVSFEVGIWQLGGIGLYLSAGDLQLGRGETIRDTAVVLSRYLDAIMIRTFDQRDVEELAEHGDVPVINGLTDEAHPCQALADLMTIRERLGRLEGVRLTYLGDGNNVCASLMVAAAKLGLDFVAATPAGYEPPDEAVRNAREAAAASGGSVELVRDAREAALGADALYTDVWTSMGQDDERERRLRDLAGYGIDERLLETAGPEAIVLHCLPAHYGEEITESVLYGPQSAVWDEAENRLHTQKALMALVIP
jgi:ornithine carbamoyltransferase